MNKLRKAILLLLLFVLVILLVGCMNVENLEDAQKALTGLEKAEKCAKLCAGEHKDIPAVLDQCRVGCYNIYYNGGEKTLDKYMEGFENG